MTFAATSGKTTYDGDNSTVAFPTVFKFVLNAHVKAILRDTADVETTWVEGTEYTLTGAGADAGGTVTATTAPATGEVLTIILDVPFTQAKSLPLGGAFPSTQVEEALDLLAMGLAKLNEVDNRTFKVPETDSQSGSQLDIPIDTVRASKFLAFDALGQAIAAAGTSADLAPVSAFINTLLDDIDAATGRGTLNAAGSPLSEVLDSAGFAIDESEGAAVASAATTDIWATDGNTIHVTGTATITSFGTAPRAGAWRRVIFDGALTLTDGANLNLQGDANISTAADDFAFVYAETTTLFKVLYFRKHGGAVAGGIVQVANTQTGAVATGTTTIPLDDTIPQNTEGTEFMTLAITPKDANNLLDIEVVINLTHSSAAADNVTAALFQDTTADALAACFDTRSGVAASGVCLSFRHRMTAGTTSPTTFKVRAGVVTAGTMTMNGGSGVRRYGGVLASSITITEVRP